MINPIQNEYWQPITGDDEPYLTMYYRDVPNGYRIENLPIPDNVKYPYLNANWSRLVGLANKFYRNCEINGETLADFFANLDLSLDLGKDRLEKLISNMDLIVFERGSITTRILSEDTESNENSTKSGNNTDTESIDISKARTGSNADNETKNFSKGKTGSNADNETKNLSKGKTGTNADNETVNITDQNVELAFNSSNDDPSAKVVKSGTDNITHTISETETETGTDNISHTINETETETGTDNISHVIDESETETQNNEIEHTINESDSRNATSEKGLDETISINRYQGENGIDYFEKLISIYPNLPMMFIDIFKDDFILKEVLIW